MDGFLGEWNSAATNARRASGKPAFKLERATQLVRRRKGPLVCPKSQGFLPQSLEPPDLSLPKLLEARPCHGGSTDYVRTLTSLTPVATTYPCRVSQYSTGDQISTKYHNGDAIVVYIEYLEPKVGPFLAYPLHTFCWTAACPDPSSAVPPCHFWLATTNFCAAHP